jgi:hypothetical protein
MSEFVFMLTRDDRTVVDALDAYESVRHTGLRYVGFKDIGASKDTLVRLAEIIRSDGRSAVLEVVSLTPEDELRSVRAGIEIGVDILMGGTHPDLVLPALEGRAIRYFPFPGTVVDHPSVLTGDIEEIAEQGRRLTQTPGIHGLDLLAYRHSGNVPALMSAVQRESRGPVVVAGSVDRDERIRAVSSAGVWAFTIGGAIFDRRFVPGGSYAEQIVHVLRVAAHGA